MLQIRGLRKTFHPGTIHEKIAIGGVDLTFRDGDFVTIIGGNGAGKSTLLNLVAGVFPPDSGSIRLDGTELTAMPEHQRAALLGRVFQDPMLGTAADMSIEENLALASRRGQKRSLHRGVTKAERDEFTRRLATLDLGLEQRLDARVGLLSGGQRQALTLLMATMQRPSLLLLDEHTAALDPRTAEKVLQLTCQIVESEGLTAMMVTHNMKDAIAIGNRLIMMNAGRVVLDISGEEKKRLTVESLMASFARVAHAEFVSDKALLA
ncbi:MAG: ABC transporter ATP-binding protein [Clostridia bacterium]|nr:ABC transporter ATP-binding protein [Clostridia bacterium]MBQ3076601.1 ABC transporter ATP-binding protein [Clostridia bacterium]